MQLWHENWLAMSPGASKLILRQAKKYTYEIDGGKKIFCTATKCQVIKWIFDALLIPQRVHRIGFSYSQTMVGQYQ
jgi:hypothetical protein